MCISCSSDISHKMAISFVESVLFAAVFLVGFFFFSKVYLKLLRIYKKKMNLLPMFSQALKKFEASFSKVRSHVSLKYTTVCNIYIYTHIYTYMFSFKHYKFNETKGFHGDCVTFCLFFCSCRSNLIRTWLKKILLTSAF